MKSTELRIGNLVYRMVEVSGIIIPNESMAFKVLQIELFKCNVLAYDKNPAEEVRWPTMQYNMIASIPLTEEWLLKFGFERHSSNAYYWLNWGRNGVQIVKWSDYYKKYTFELGKGFNKVLDHVHQLQNLYFALTGNELTIK